MQDKLLTSLSKQGNKVEDLVKRFSGNEDLSVKVLKKFTEDATYSCLLKNIHDNNIQEARVSLHTLKGITANLGLTQLTQCCDAIAQAIRTDDNKELQLALRNIKQVYQNTIVTIS